MAIHSSTLAWRIPWIEEPGGLQSMRSQESDTTERLTHISKAAHNIKPIPSSVKSESERRSVVSDSLQPHGL